MTLSAFGAITIKRVTQPCSCTCSAESFGKQEVGFIVTERLSRKSPHSCSAS